MITVLFTILSALYDTNKHIQDHSYRFMIRFAIISIISFFEMPTILIGIWRPTVIQLFLNTSIFYLLFDYILNLLNNNKWNYIGTVATIDIFWKNVGGWKLQLIFKLIFFITIILIKCQTL